MVTHAYSPICSGGQDGSIPWTQEFETRLGNIVRPQSQKKKKTQKKEHLHVFKILFRKGLGEDCKSQDKRHDLVKN